MKLKLFSILLVCVFVLACTSSKSDAEAYIESVNPIFEEGISLIAEVNNLYENPQIYSIDEIQAKCLDYEQRYQDIFDRFVSKPCPQECLEFREHTIDFLNLSTKELIEYAAYHSTGNIEHLYKSEEYYTDSKRSGELAIAEMSRILDE